MSRTLNLPVCWWNNQDTWAHRSLSLDAARTAIVLIDCDGSSDPARYDHDVKIGMIAPALHAKPEYRWRIFITRRVAKVAR